MILVNSSHGYRFGQSMLFSQRVLCRRATRVPFRSFVDARQLHAFHPLIRDFVSTLGERQPCFAVSPSKVQVLFDPPKFYETLLSMIQRAETRIFISSLYIGSGESKLVSSLEAALFRSPNLHVYLQLDFNRSTRPGKTSTAHLLLPLLRKFPQRVHVSLFRSPSLRGILAQVVPPRFNEGWGTWHAKIYGVDDDVMISGANLNKSYFTDRQDRYLYFSSTPELASYCFSFLKIVSSFSFYLSPVQQIPLPSSKHSYQHENYTLHWPDPVVHPHYIQSKAAAALASLQKSQMRHYEPDGMAIPSSNPSSVEEKVLLFPIIQAGQFGIHEEESSLDILFRHLASHSQRDPSSKSLLAPRQRPLMDLTSGYFGLYKPYQDHILSCHSLDCRIVCSSPEANGFYGSKGISGRIPEGYTYLEQRFMNAVKASGRTWTQSNVTDSELVDSMRSPIGNGVRLSEWRKDGWTYHAKGIWLSPTPNLPPVLTLFGSTNLNSRSAHLDTELSFLMALPSESLEDTQSASVNNNLTQAASMPPANKGTPAFKLRSKLREEISRLYRFAHEWQGETRAVRWGTKLIVSLVGGML